MSHRLPNSSCPKWIDLLISNLLPFISPFFPYLSENLFFQWLRLRNFESFLTLLFLSFSTFKLPTTNPTGYFFKIYLETNCFLAYIFLCSWSKLLSSLTSLVPTICSQHSNHSNPLKRDLKAMFFCSELSGRFLVTWNTSQTLKCSAALTTTTPSSFAPPALAYFTPAALPSLQVI